MLYEIIGIARPGNIAEIKELVLTAGQLVLRNGGVIRDISNWGVFLLPSPISKHQVRHRRGHYFVMRYDAGVQAHAIVRDNLAIDPRILRSTGVKLGNGKLDNLSKFGKIPWRSLE
ncbi:ribosomal protein S6 [Lasiosphaeris hirsuta]|uniref:Small ribosomal subunit protein bS6m n=1 Tax=Lasiosphaeris hirsuta TaxID=260670 RepID=A0AA39ZV94_9PEZI|nr:ribosomal protein S6 [Lasiosphaeris hirsuta]